MKNLKLAIAFCTSLALVATFGAVQLAGSPAEASTVPPCIQCSNEYQECLNSGKSISTCNFFYQKCLLQC